MLKNIQYSIWNIHIYSKTKFKFQHTRCFCLDVVSFTNTSSTAVWRTGRWHRYPATAAYMLHDTDSTEKMSSPLKIWIAVRGGEKRKRAEECFPLLRYLSKTSTGRCLCFFAQVCVRVYVHVCRCAKIVLHVKHDKEKQSNIHSKQIKSNALLWKWSNRLHGCTYIWLIIEMI